jgi:hypothetical protein
LLLVVLALLLLSWEMLHLQHLDFHQQSLLQVVVEEVKILHLLVMVDLVHLLVVQ